MDKFSCSAPMAVLEVITLYLGKGEGACRKVQEGGEASTFGKKPRFSGGNAERNVETTGAHGGTSFDRPDCKGRKASRSCLCRPGVVDGQITKHN